MNTIIEVATAGVGAQQDDAAPSAVSWAAVLAGAVVAAAVTLIMLALGTGLGLASISPWASLGGSITTFTVMSAIWLIVTQWFAAGLGGYLAGRLRTRWTRTHVHEVFFRDTAHGFLTWALASVAVAAIFGSAAVTAGEHAAAPGGPNPTAFAYDVDSLFRAPRAPAATVNADARAEAARILAVGAINGIVPAADSTYLAQLVVAQTGVAPAEAESRVSTVLAREQAAEIMIKQAADNARKAAASLAMFSALSMLIGALIACIAAALGGQQRDEHL
jgi:hypothetical protein